MILGLSALIVAPDISSSYKFDWMNITTPWICPILEASLIGSNLTLTLLLLEQIGVAVKRFRCRLSIVAVTVLYFLEIFALSLSACFALPPLLELIDPDLELFKASNPGEPAILPTIYKETHSQLFSLLIIFVAPVVLTISFSLTRSLLVARISGKEKKKLGNISFFN